MYGNTVTTRSYECQMKYCGKYVNW